MISNIKAENVPEKQIFPTLVGGLLGLKSEKLDRDQSVFYRFLQENGISRKILRVVRSFGEWAHSLKTVIFQF